MRAAECILVLGALVLGCGGEEDAGGTTVASTGPVGSSSSSGPDSTTTISTSGVSATTTTDPGSTTQTPASSSSGDADESSTTADEGSSSTGCTPGELDCACDEEGMCAEGLECTDELCGEIAECQDDEFGDITTEATAHFLGEIDDDDDNGGTVMGMLTGPDDVDWFRYDGTDSFLDTVDPFRTVVSSAPVRFCKFANCPGEDGIAETDFPCQDDAVATTSPDGRPGCCADALIHVPDAVCGSSGINDDSMAVWIRVDQPEEACVTYAFDYHF